MYKIKTPNHNYNGVTYGVKFTNGLGETDSEEVKNILVHDFGYELVSSSENQPNDTENKEEKAKTAKRTPSSSKKG
jgi:hypothetical protein